jgi:S-adenosylmethionine:tRNA ribosyltransferase-isomerase
MLLSDFDYNLPPELIATHPAEPRDQARLLVLNKTTGTMSHSHFFNLLDFLQPGDLLIANNSKVIPARLTATKSTGGSVEVFLSKNLGQSWEVLIKGRVSAGAELTLSTRLRAVVQSSIGDGVWQLAFNLSGSEFMQELELIGELPLPPYIIKARQASSTTDKQDYQTVYAAADKQGSVAAPTAGLHFTDGLITKLKENNIFIEYLTLHVGLGTFLPVKTDNIIDHKMHSEWAELSADLIEKIIKAKRSGRRIIAVGTTSARALEYAFAQINLGDYLSGKATNTGDFAAWVDIFIYPPYQFKVVDALITNFHLPKSTLLMLVSSLASREIILSAYQEAIAKRYRFYSYGDAMFIS